MLRFASVALISLAVAAPALASTTFTATLATPVDAPNRVTAYDAVWVCEDSTCEAVLNRSSATVRVCKKVVEEIGAISAFGTAEDALDEAEVAECNASLN
tara:strand:- start:10 stop:309 length:300 start_codon:yes stop_codon:yes gene_type:complete